MGGSGLIATRLGIQLANKGHDVHFLFYKKPFLLKNYDNFNNITFHQVDRVSHALFSEIGSPFTIQSAAKLASIVKTEKIDIIHSHYAIPHAVSSYLASKISAVKSIVTTHGSDVHTLGHDHRYREIIALALRNTTTTTSVSKYLALETENAFKLPSKSVKVIYDFIDPEEFKPTTSQRSLTIVQASNFRPIKQVPLLIEIFAKVVQNYPEWKLNLIGNGPEWPISKRRARELKIKDSVNFLGVQKNIPEQFSNASIIASTSENESFGLTIAEGMACETPVWAPRIGGIPEVCIDGQNGYLWEINDFDDAIEKLCKLMDNEKLRQNFGRNGRNRVQKYFSTELIVNQYEKLYEEIVDPEKIAVSDAIKSN